jgi:hypothetical protein
MSAHSHCIAYVVLFMWSAIDVVKQKKGSRRMLLRLHMQHML